MHIKHLGHQGWSISAATGRANILLDYVEKNMGHGLITLPRYPAIALDLDLASFHALIISHEHADHFEIDFLIKLRKANPTLTVCIPDLSSVALSGILRDIGYQVLRYSAFQTIAIGDLEVTALPCEFSKLEPDLYGLLFRDKSDASTFLTSIDGMLSRRALDYILRVAPERSLDNFTNNYVVRSLAQHGIAHESAEQHSAYMRQFLASYCQEWNARRVVISGLGWCYPSPFEDLNALMYPVTHRDLIDDEIVDAVDFIHACMPGDAFGLSEHKAILDGRHSQSMPDERGFARSDAPFTPGYHFLPLAPDPLAVLHAWIQDDLAKMIGACAKKLCEACHDIRSEGSKKAFVLVVENGGAQYLHDFDFARLTFRDLPPGPADRDRLQSDYAMGLVVPARVLEAIRVGQDEAHICFEVACSSWNSRWDLLPECPDVDIAACLHPRYRAELYYAQYRQVVHAQREPSCQP